MQFVAIKKRSVILLSLVIIGVISTFTWFTLKFESIPVFNEQQKQEIRDISIVAVEFEGKTADGKELEIYRWDPGTIFIHKGEKVRLRLFGINGDEHPFVIEGTDIKGTVVKGKETVIPVSFAKEGIYRLICYTHVNYESNGPMIAEIIVK